MLFLGKKIKYVPTIAAVHIPNNGHVKNLID